MKWTKVNPDELPKEEVLAVASNQEFLVGWLELVESYNNVICTEEHVELLNITHYITTADLWESLKHYKDKL